MSNILVVGQGIAGSVLAWTLQKKGAEVTLADADFPARASSVAAGIINPVTGKRYVKTWLLDTLLPFAEKTYGQIGLEIGQTLWNKRPILRLLASPEEENNWSARCEQTDYQALISERAEAGAWANRLHAGFRFGQIQQAAQVNFPRLCAGLRKKWVAQNRFWPMDLRPENAAHWAKRFDFVVFCEGACGATNPFFPGLPWQLAKGEALEIAFDAAISPAPFEMLKKNLLVVPLGENRYWAGATNEWQFEDANPTESGKQQIVKDLQEIFSAPFRVLAHHAAIRPTVKDRRPLLGVSVLNPKIGIFNGLGTKGALLAPYCAEVFAEFLLHGKCLPPEVDIARV